MPRPPRIFPGYSVAAVATLALFATAPGQTFIVSQLNTEAIRGTLGISTVHFNNTYALATVLAALPLVFTGALADRLGPRRTLAIVALAFALGCLVLSRARGPATLFLGFFCVRFLGQGSLALVASHSVAMWFHRRLGAVNGIKTVVLFGLWAYLPQLTLRLTGHVGWRQTYVIFAAAIAALVIPAALLFVRNAPEDVGLRTDNDPPDAPRGPHTRPDSIDAPAKPAEPSFTPGQARRTWAYWVLALSSVLPSLIGTAILFDLIPIVSEKGLTPTAAANAVSAWSITMAVTAIPAGVLTDRARPALLLGIGMAVAAVSAAAIVFAESPLQIAGGMAAFGLGMSLASACGAATIARYFGRLHHGKIRSSLTRMGIIGTGLGPVATAQSFALTGSYRPALWLFTALALAAACLMATLRTPAPPAPPAPPAAE